MIMHRSVWRFWALAAALIWQFWPGAGTAQADDGFFYVAPKVVFGQQKADFGASTYEIKGIPGHPIQPKFPRVYEGKSLSATDSLTFGALAFGLNFYNRFQVPLRLELEISTRADAKTRGEMEVWPDNPDKPEHHDIWIEATSLAYTMHTAFVNAYLDWHNSSAFTPYVGGGLGAAFLKGRATATFYGDHGFIDTSNPSNSIGRYGDHGRFNYEKRKTQFAWHLDLGFSYDLTEKMALDLSYRYLDTGEHLKVAREPYISKRPYGECIFTGPSEINFEPTHQVVLGVRYSF